MSKLTKHQRDELKSLVANATVRRLTAKETSTFVLERLGVSISIDHIRHLKTGIKRDYARELQSLQKDKDSYMQCIFWDRVHELEYQQRVLHEVIDNNKESNPDVVVRAVNVLHDITFSGIYKPVISQCFSLSYFAGARTIRTITITTTTAARANRSKGAYLVMSAANAEIGEYAAICNPEVKDVGTSEFHMVPQKVRR